MNAVTQHARVKADIAYIDGPLRGIRIKDGYSVPYPMPNAVEARAWLADIYHRQQAVKAAGASHSYLIMCDPRVEVTA